jgi:hypothetical protein
VLHLNHEVDLDRIEPAPRLAKVPLETRSAHRQRMVEDNQLVAFSSFGRNVPAFERRAVIRRKIDITPTRHPVVVGSLVQNASQRFDDTGQRLDLGVVFSRNCLELFQGLVHSLF